MDDQQYDKFQFMLLMRVCNTGQNVHDCIGGIKSSQREQESALDVMVVNYFNILLINNIYRLVMWSIDQ
jgi:hypothetical protein